jgi:hypothetical protein
MPVKNLPSKDKPAVTGRLYVDQIHDIIMKFQYVSWQEWQGYQLSAISMGATVLEARFTPAEAQ